MASAQPPSDPDIDEAPAAVRRWVMTVLFAVAVLNYVDRNMLSILQIPIKQELGLTDTQLGLLTGASFAFLYSITAIPVARLADGWVRKNVLAASLAVWSTATALTAGAGGFGALAAARMGVAAGESGCIPTSHALLSDYYPPHRRASAIAFWGLSAPAGTMIGLGLAGWLNEATGWRTAYLAAGLISALFVPVVYFTLREPPRGRYDGAAQREKPPLGVACAVLWRTKTVRYMILGVTAHAYFLYASANWAAPFYNRVHHMSVGELAVWLALLSGVAGGLGTWLGGAVTDAWAKRNPAAHALTPALAALVMAPAALAQYWAPTASASLWLAVAPAVLVNIYLAPSIATAQTLVPPGMRAFVSAAIVMIANLVGMGLGPVVTGAISDHLAPTLGAEEALRCALSAAVLGELVAAFFYLRAARCLRRAHDDRPKTENQNQDQTLGEIRT